MLMWSLCVPPWDSCIFAINNSGFPRLCAVFCHLPFCASAVMFYVVLSFCRFVYASPIQLRMWLWIRIQVFKHWRQKPKFTLMSEVFKENNTFLNMFFLFTIYRHTITYKWAKYPQLKKPQILWCKGEFFFLKNKYLRDPLHRHFARCNM